MMKKLIAEGTRILVRFGCGSAVIAGAAGSRRQALV